MSRLTFSLSLLWMGLLDSEQGEVGDVIIPHFVR